MISDGGVVVLTQTQKLGRGVLRQRDASTLHECGMREERQDARVLGALR
jgi:hypothetical protein